MFVVSAILKSIKPFYFHSYQLHLLQMNRFESLEPLRELRKYEISRTTLNRNGLHAVRMSYSELLSVGYIRKLPYGLKCCVNYFARFNLDSDSNIMSCGSALTELHIIYIV